MPPAFKTAELLGSMLRLDPVAAQLIRRIVSPQELIKLLDLEGYVAEQLAQKTDPEVPELLRLAAAERHRQIGEEGYTPAHDDIHEGGELALAAAAYATPPIWRTDLGRVWPWADEGWRPSPKDRRRELVKAIALLLAEDERLQRGHEHPLPPSLPL
jgi:hypothetical protein